MLSIGEFARYLGVSVRMLRHYDALGLLVPAWVDPRTGYRQYSPGQFERANRLIALKDLGFTLEQIGPVLDEELSVAELRAMLRLRGAQVAEQIRADQARLAHIELRLRTIEGGTMSTLEFVEKPLPALRVAEIVDSVSDQLEIGPRIGPLFERLAAALAARNVPLDRPALAWYRPEGEGMRIAAAFPVDRVDPLGGGRFTQTPPDLAEAGIELADLDAVERAVTVLHQGGMDSIGETWQALVRHVEQLGYRSTGTCREVYLHMPMDADQSTWITELQQPVA